jgi:hypothetical protein
MKYALVLGLLIAFGTGFANAHGDGLVFEQETGDYKAELEIDAREVQANLPLRLNFELERRESQEPMEFTDAWVSIIRIKTGEERVNPTVFAGGIKKPDFGAMGFTYVFPAAGSYVARVRYHAGSETLAEAEIPFEVTEGGAATPERNLAREFMIGGFGFLAGTIAAMAVRKRFFPA